MWVLKRSVFAWDSGVGLEKVSVWFGWDSGVGLEQVNVYVVGTVVWVLEQVSVWLGQSCRPCTCSVWLGQCGVVLKRSVCVWGSGVGLGKL